MSLLIKGMEMPKHCFNCSTKVDPDNRRCNIDGHVFEETLGKLTSRRDENCPMIYIPPHGRLIDADAFLALINDSTILSDFLKCIINPLIRGEPTIIPALGRGGRVMKCNNCVNLECGWCDMKADSPDPDMERDCHWFAQKTKADLIRSMTDEELAEWLDDICKSAYDEGYTKETGEPLMSPYPSTSSKWMNWLKQEVAE